MPFPVEDIRYAKLCLIKNAIENKKMYMAAKLLRPHHWVETKNLINQGQELMAMSELLLIQANECTQYLRMKIGTLNNLNDNMQNIRGNVYFAFINKAGIELENGMRPNEWRNSLADGKFSNDDINHFSAYRKKIWEKNIPSIFQNDQDVLAFEKAIALKLETVESQRGVIAERKGIIKLNKETEIMYYRNNAAKNRSIINSIIIGRPEYNRAKAQALITEALKKTNRDLTVKTNDLDGEGLSISYYILEAVNKSKSWEEARALFTWGLMWYLQQNGHSHFFEIQNDQGQSKLITNHKGHTILDKLLCSEWEEELFSRIIMDGFRLSKTAITHKLISKNKSLLHYLIDKLNISLLTHIRTQHTINWLLLDDDGNTLLDCLIQKIQQHKLEILALENVQSIRAAKSDDKVTCLFAMIENFRGWYDELKNREQNPREGVAVLSSAERAVLYFIEQAKFEKEQAQAQNIFFQIYNRLFSSSIPNQESILAMELVLFSSTIRKCDLELFDELVKQQEQQKGWSIEHRNKLGLIIDAMEKQVGFAHPNFLKIKEARDILVENNSLPSDAQFNHKQYNTVAAFVENQESFQRLIAEERTAKEQAEAREAQQKRETVLERTEKEKSLAREEIERAEKERERTEKERERAEKERERAEKEAALERLAIMEARLAAFEKSTSSSSCSSSSSSSANAMATLGLFANEPVGTQSPVTSPTRTVELTTQSEGLQNGS